MSGWPHLHMPAAGAAALALLSACSLAPEYEVPQTAAPVHYKESAPVTAPPGWQPASPQDAAPRGPWWRTFGDPQLDALEARLPEASQDLKLAIARYMQARAVAKRSRADLLPALGAGASAVRGRTSENVVSTLAGETSNTFDATLDLSWEIDLFGRLRNAYAAAEAEADASRGDLAATDLALQAELAMDYFALRGADATLKLLDDTVQAYDRALSLTRNRYDGGIAAAADVDRALSQLENARAQQAAVRLQRAQYEHAIAVLLGTPPSNFSLPVAPFVATPPVIDAGLPSTLLQRRPDIAAAERRVASANAQIGVARAAWFPVFGLGGSAGYRSVDDGNWLEASSRFWSLGPSLSLPIFDGGARSAFREQAIAAHDEASAQYRQTVLIAYQEVEDNLAALNHLADESASDQRAAEAAERALSHADARYRAGVADYVEVTTLQTAALDAQRAALDASVRRTVAAVQLVRALGGGWNPAGRLPGELADNGGGRQALAGGAP